ncbi:MULTISPECIES: HNH endonuclease [Sinorhizobium]|uniref:HNH endonuclease n=1 Tax=Sinorhizobium TaxID=28105 RepID=UPI0024B234C5|nr:HNH endonuclease signature motif containing protein [Sinorhizobium terangae]WFU51877.1 HNH endonuclease signature motif containing protein [Sinorhizobium terangae]
MLVLNFPKEDDDGPLTRILARKGWGRYSSAWLKAYSDYVQFQGDPWQVSPAPIPKTRQKAQRKFYDTRAGGGALARIRSTAGLKCCPMCGSDNSGTLDHYLPRKEYPEFSIFSKNLIPACPACNSSVKGDIYKGTLSPERFIHPYFDKLAAKAVWRVKIVAPFDAPNFTAEPMPGFSAMEEKQIQFHIGHILGEQFQLKMGTLFGDFPQRIRDGMEHIPKLDRASTETGLKTILRDVVTSRSINSWEAALVRGTVSDPDVTDHLTTLANGCVAVPIDM